MGYIAPENSDINLVITDYIAPAKDNINLVVGDVGASTPYIQVLIDTPTNIFDTTAQLNGHIENMGNESSLFVSFEYGKTDSFGSSTMPQEIFTNIAFNAEITELDSDTTYHCRIKITSGASTWYSNSKTFLTSSLGSIYVGGEWKTFYNAWKYESGTWVPVTSIEKVDGVFQFNT